MNDETAKPAKPPNSRRSPQAAAARVDTVLDWARGAGAGDLLAGGLERYLQRRRRQRLALASGVFAVLFVAGTIWLPLREAASPAPASTANGSAVILRPEQRTLPDGSKVELKGGAEVEVAFTDAFRRVVLRSGEAHFQVTKDAQRPFVVAAGGIEVRAVGTAFAVDLEASAVDVLVTEGRVAVDTPVPPAASAPSTVPPPPLAAVDAGRRIVIARETAARALAGTRISELSASDIQARLAWRVPRLKFAAAPLAQVVAMFNEHAVPGRDARLVLAPGVPANFRVSGTLRADDVDSLLRLLAGEFGISAETRTGEIVLRRP